jgi:peptidoglycan/xylan/chitin deacetylase (PgdA/CDA1 family)
LNWIKSKILGFFVKTKGVFSSPILGGKGIIFMLHRVLPEVQRNAYSLNKDLAITPEKLEEFILFFQKKGFVFISLDELTDWLDRKHKINHKFICLTFDDGYKDNLLFGLPVLKKHNVPAAIYVTNCFPGGSGVLWWYLFEEYVKSNKQLQLTSSIGNYKFFWNNDDEAHAQFGSISNAIKSIPFIELNEVLKMAFKIDDIELTAQVKSESLSWEELKMIAEEPLITIGAHTMNHIALKQQNKVLVEQELRNSKLELESKIGRKVTHFAYPYGGKFDVSKVDIELTQKVGFKTATLNQPGNIFKSNRHSKFALARMPLGNRIDDERMNYYLNGIYHFSVNGFSKNLY